MQGGRVWPVTRSRSHCDCRASKCGSNPTPGLRSTHAVFDVVRTFDFKFISIMDEGWWKITWAVSQINYTTNEHYLIRGETVRVSPIKLEFYSRGTITPVLLGSFRLTGSR